MKKLLLFLVCVGFLFTGCFPYRDCCEVSVDSYNKAVSQGYQSRIVVGQVWGKNERFRHAENQIYINGEWCFLDNSTGQPLTGWYGKHIVGPTMTIEEIFPTKEQFVTRYMYDRKNYIWSEKPWF